MTIIELLTEFERRFQPDKAEGIDAVYQLELEGQSGGRYFMTVKDQKFSFEEGTSENPTVTLISSTKDFIDLSTGKANPMMLMMQKRLKVKGSFALATRFQSLFHR